MILQNKSHVIITKKNKLNNHKHWRLTHQPATAHYSKLRRSTSALNRSLHRHRRRRHHRCYRRQDCCRWQTSRRRHARDIDRRLRVRLATSAMKLQQTSLSLSSMTMTTTMSMARWLRRHPASRRWRADDVVVEARWLTLATIPRRITIGKWWIYDKRERASLKKRAKHMRTWERLRARSAVALLASWKK